MHLNTVQYGDQGDLVATLQDKLATHGHDPGSVDGIFGDRTRAAVEAFQTDSSLQVDGICGNQTWAALEGDLNVPPGETHDGDQTPIELDVNVEANRVQGDSVHVSAFIKNIGKAPVTDSSLIDCQLRVTNPAPGASPFEITLQKQTIPPIDPGSDANVHFYFDCPEMTDHFYNADVNVFDDNHRYSYGQDDFH